MTVYLTSLLWSSCFPAPTAAPDEGSAPLLLVHVAELSACQGVVSITPAYRCQLCEYLSVEWALPPLERRKRTPGLLPERGRGGAGVCFLRLESLHEGASDLRICGWNQSEVSSSVTINTVMLFDLQFPCSPECMSRINSRASLVVRWLRICLPMQGTRVRALVWEDPTCHGATRPVSHNY